MVEVSRGRLRVAGAVLAALAVAQAAVLLLRPDAGIIAPAAVEARSYFSAAQLERAEAFRGPQVLLALGVLGALGMLVVVLGAEVLQRDDGGGVQGVVPAALRDGLVDGGLERLLVHHQVGLDDLGRLLRGQLEVVRLTSRLGQAGDVSVRPGDPLGDELERVRRRDDGDLVRTGGSAGRRSVPAAGGDEQDGARHQQPKPRLTWHDNHFQ